MKRKSQKTQRQALIGALGLLGQAKPKHAGRASTRRMPSERDLHRSSSNGRRFHILIVVQNLPVPLDRRVWLECQALVDRGYEVSVICPKGPGDSARQQLDGVHIYKYRPAPPATGAGGYVVEFAYCWLRTALLSLEVWMRRPFDILQACNPPDTYWLLAKFWKPRGVCFVFDQHDLNPELFLSRFGEPKTVNERMSYQGLLWLERMTYRTAHRVIATNESYKRLAVSRGERKPFDVTVVRSGPDTSRMRPIYTTPLEDQKPYTLVYLGIMGPQDGVDMVLDVMVELVHVRGRRDVRATLMGFGDCLDALKQRSTDLGLTTCVTFTGRANKSMIGAQLSAADVGLCPDLKSPLNDLSTMNKTMEYMAYALPSVSFDLAETRVSAGDTALFVPSGDLIAFADAVERLLDDPILRADMGLRARRRVAGHLDWRAQAEAYVAVFDRLCGMHPPTHTDPSVLGGQEADGQYDELGRLFVNLEDTVELRRFVMERTPPVIEVVTGGTSSS
jgi:glycosyltransferase involved in cell wall biosynthesis